MTDDKPEMSMHDKRVATYRALKACCWDRPAPLEDIRAALEYEEPKLEAYLDGLVSLRELERATAHVPKVATADDGFGRRGFGFDDDDASVEVIEGYKLTEFGQSWTTMMLAGAEPSER